MTVLTEVIFETATLADVIKKADRIAPSRGSAFDKAAGIVMDISLEDPSEPSVVVRATNLDIFSMEWVDPLEITGQTTTWRIPSQLFARTITSLPIGSNKTVTLREVHPEGARYSFLEITSDRMKAKINLLDASFYPDWKAFDPDDLVAVVDLGGRLSQVEWACDKATVPISGVCFDGSMVMATDRYKLAVAPLSVPNMPTSRVVVPGGILGSLLKQTGEIQIGFTDNMMLLMPDEHTQIKAILFEADYPALDRIMARNQPASITFKKNALLDMISRALVFAGADRLPNLRVFLGREEAAVMVSNLEIGHLGDVIELPGQATHSRVMFSFSPGNLQGALSNAPSEEITLHYDPDKPTALVRIEGGSGYECWVIPRRENEASSSA